MKLSSVFTIMLSIVCYSNGGSSGYLCFGGGYPLGVINNVNTAMQNEANTFSGVVNSIASGGSFLIDYTFLSTPKDSLATTLFGILGGYSYNGTSEASATLPGISNQVINMKLKASIHELKCEPGLLFQASDMGFIFIGGGAVYSIVNGTVSGLDNAGSKSILSGSLGSGFGLCGIARCFYIFDRTQYMGIGIQAEVSNKNLMIGAFIKM